MNLLLRVLMLLAGLVLAASLATVGLAMFALWGARAAWARLTGRPVTPFIVRMRPFGAFGDMMARAPQGSRTPRSDAAGARIGDVTDVEPKPPVR
jgi:hypothetical protein